MQASEKIRQKLPWIPEETGDTDKIPAGDMPGDKVRIGANHFRFANTLLPELLELLIPVLDNNPFQRAVISVFGGSGSGKSGTASVLSFYLNNIGLGSYTLSGDNYPLDTKIRL